MFNLDDLIVPLPKKKVLHDWVCVSCLRITMRCVTCLCGSVEFVPYLDRRPLLLSKETQHGILALIDEAAGKVVDLGIDEQLFYAGEYMPFLNKLLVDAELAQQRELTGVGYRKTDLDSEDILSLCRDMRMPPTSR